MQISTDNSPPQGGVGGGPHLLPREGLGVGSLFLRLDRNEKAEAQWSYIEGMTNRLMTEKNFFQNYGTSSQVVSILLIISFL